MQMQEFFPGVAIFTDIFTDQVQMVNKPTYISGSLIDHIYIKRALTEEFFC